MQTLKLKIPSKLKPLFKEKKRFYFIEGGRGGAKSWSVADFVLLQAMVEKKRVLCTREVQKSISESVHHLLNKKINEFKLPFAVLKNEITCSANGSNFIFHGLRDDTSKGIKSLEDVDIAWVEEAQYVSKSSLDILIPTIRKPGSILIFTYNRKELSDPVHDLMESIPDDEKIHVNINYDDNPFCSEELKKEALRSRLKAEKTGDWGEYEYVWMGKPLARKGKIFQNYRLEDFSDILQTFDQFKHGLDWGFADDPLAYSKLYYNRKKEQLYVCAELYLFGHSDNKSHPLIKAHAGNDTIVADSSEPKSINGMRALGLNIIGAKKGPGSVETGIKFLQSLEIIVHPSCANFLKELENYRYKQDKAGNILPEPIDAFNHLIDSARYAMESDMGGGSYSGMA
ncbi:PBSX family phage terminase large subunit [Polynucleobacter sp.]|uniref:PBSX family phage terminase large subunit n=1 Tax=Polynucleobacter sp. TaxID=2029855 RepID=UPI003F69FA1F